MTTVDKLCLILTLNSCELPDGLKCVCNKGFMLDGEKCVPVEDCGCVIYNNVYVETGEKWASVLLLHVI